MKKILLLLSAMIILGYGAFAQTQRTNRTHTRPHNETDTVNKRNQMRNDPDTRMNPVNDMDRNNPTTPDKSNSNGTTPKKNEGNESGNKR